jgi:hypothetical protein
MVWVRVSLAVYTQLVIGGEMAKGEMGINRQPYQYLQFIDLYDHRESQQAIG